MLNKASISSIKIINSKQKLLQLVLDSIRSNTRNSPHYVDCELRIADKDPFTDSAQRSGQNI
ncbi:MAG: hypothetical protein ACN4GM_02435 [Gammaproteobacteria bacterium]